MNKDEMSDDAEFEAFLKGEGDLARALQGLPQPSPSAALDAAILGRIGNSMEQRQQAAANDPGEQTPAPRLARGLGMRWRVPAGIAASALVGLFALQAYRSNVSGDLVSAPAQERAADAILAQERSAVPAAPAAESPAVPPAATAPPLARPEQLQDAVSKERAPVKRAKPTVRSMAEAPSPAPEPAAAASADAAPAIAPAPAPAPAPVLAPPSSEASLKAAASARDDLYEVERRRAESKPAVQMLRESPVPAPPPPAGIANATGVKPSAGAVPLNYSKVEITGSSIRRDHSASVREASIARIEALLKDGDEDAALREWVKFREKYPNQQVSPQLEEKMKALAEQGR